MRLEYLVDTDWVIHYLNGQPQIVARLDVHDLTLLTGNLRHFETVEGLRIGS